jgi:hypothetical protein
MLTMSISPQSRHRAPVFVLGSPRSGTTLLYDMLLSAGGFAVYLAESNVFNLLAPRFGDLIRLPNRQKLLRAWLDSKLFKASGLQAQQIEKRILEECRNCGDFLRIVMDEIAREQGMQRWAENSPEGILHLRLIKQHIPDALIINIIRDGRDVAMSLGRLNYIRPLPWEERHSLIGAGLYWEWIVQRGREYGKQLGADYLEIHFEDLISSPQDTLTTVGRFIDHELDYDRIQAVAYGSLTKPNTSFRTESPKAGFSPIGRWKKGFSPEQLFRFERMVGNTLLQLGYAAATDGPRHSLSVEMKCSRLLHRSYYAGKLWFKGNRLVRALRPTLTGAEIDQTVLADDRPAEIKRVFSRPSSD